MPSPLEKLQIATADLWLVLKQVPEPGCKTGVSQQTPPGRRGIVGDAILGGQGHLPFAATAAEIQKLQQIRRSGQLSLFDVFSANQLIERRPCIFDNLDRLVIIDDTADPTDPEVSEMEE